MRVRNLRIVVIRLMVSVSLCPKVITLSGFHCTLIPLESTSKGDAFPRLGILDHKTIRLSTNVCSFKLVFEPKCIRLSDASKLKVENSLKALQVYRQGKLKSGENSIIFDL